MKKRGIIILAVLMCVFSLSACKSKQPAVKADSTTISEQHSSQTQESSKESEAELSKPGMFEREERSLSPAGEDNVIDIGGNATEEQTSNIEKPAVDESKYPIGEQTRAEAFLERMKTETKYVFTCGEIKIIRNGDDYIIVNKGYSKKNGKYYIDGKETEQNFDDQLASAYADLYPLSKSNITKSVVDYELYKLEDSTVKVTFHENGISIIVNSEQTNFDLSEPTADDLKLLK